MSSMFNIGVSGLNAARSSFSTTSHNIGNVNTDGYHRQINGQAAQTPNYSGTAYTGNGVMTTSISRIYNAHLEKVVQSNTTMEAYYKTQVGQLNQLDQILADPDTGLTPAVQSFFDSLQVITQPNMPASIPARQSVVNQAQALVNRFQTMDSRIEEIRDGVNGQIKLMADSINAQAGKIATLNQQIRNLSIGDAVVPNDLLDKRDQAVLDLNKVVKANVVKQDNNTYNVFIGSGQSLVLDDIAMVVSAGPSYEDPQRYALSYKDGQTTVEIPSKMIDGGSIGGMLNFRRDALDVAQNALNKVAIGLAQAMNAQHLLGVDMNGVSVASKPAAQREMFQIGTFSQNLRFVPNSNNKGAAAVTLSAKLNDFEALKTTGAPIGGSDTTGFSQLSNNDYKFVSQGGGNFVIQRMPEGTLVAPSDASGVILPTTLTTVQLAAGVVIDGVTATLTVGAAPPAGDSFLLQPTRGAIAQLAVVISQPSEVATSSRLTGQAVASAAGAANSGKASVVGVWERPVNSLVLTPNTALPPAGAVRVPTDSATVVAPDTQVGTPPPANFRIEATAGGGWKVTSSSTAAPVNTDLSATYKVVVNTDVAGGFKVVTTAAPERDSGVEFKIDGTPIVGDTFEIRSKKSREFGVSDSFNLLQMTALQTRNTMEGSGSAGGTGITVPTTTFVGSYSRMVSLVANKAAEGIAAGDAATAALKEATLTRESESGVNLDEEAANLLRYQQAYQASSKTIEIARSLFDSILSAVSR